MASPINNGTTISNSCSHSILDKEINIADELHIKNYAKNIHQAVILQNGCYRK